MSNEVFLPAIRKSSAFHPWDPQGHWFIRPFTNLLSVGLASHRKACGIRTSTRNKRRIFIPESEKDNYDLQLVQYRAFQSLKGLAENNCSLERVRICDAKVIMVRGESGFEPSYLLMEWLWNKHSDLLKKARFTKGDPLFIPRDNRTLMIVSSEDPYLPDMLGQLIQQKPSEHHLSLLPLILSQGHFIEWQPNPVNPAAAQVAQIRRMEYMELFNHQAKVPCVQEGADFVGQAKLIDWSDGSKRTITRYFPEKGINSLPLTDFLLIPYRESGLVATRFGLLRDLWPEGFSSFKYSNARVLLRGLPDPQIIEKIRTYRSTNRK